MLKVISPIDNSIYAERPLAKPADLERALDLARKAQRAWRSVPLADRTHILTRFCDLFEAKRDEIALELTWQMGRPSRYAPNEVRGTLERARHMIAIAPSALADIDAGPKEHFKRFIRREPLGVVLTIAAWNYPYLIAVNSVVPALMAGNAVVLKHSAQTPLCAERFATALQEAGLPHGVFQALHMSHDDTERAIRDPRVDFVAFTGSVAGGHAVQRAAAERFIGTGLELGGCDPVYVRNDANLAHAIENIVDGFVDLTRKYVLGNPLDAATTLGPVVRAAAADTIRTQIAASIKAGGKPVIAETDFAASRAGTPYLAPQVLLDVDNSTPMMREEIFGPVAGIMKVQSDEQAIALMNDSAYGLTAAIWTADADAALSIGDRVETGTWFMNRCDYLDPALAWVGVKDSGRGCTLAVVGYEHLTRPKSFHLRTHV